MIALVRVGDGRLRLFGIDRPGIGRHIDEHRSAPAAIGAYAVALNVSAGTITSSPQPMPSAFRRPPS